ncbi:MAG TPA: peptide-methionine (R)-S-oxide reductase MsrB [Tepidisphaeraceae bacterium]|nr:peptide-methionine (R)-S-oxide reductase MsrB [Tepidisphaeraceae bacterium]
MRPYLLPLTILALTLGVVLINRVTADEPKKDAAKPAEPAEKIEKVTKTDEEWKKQLDPLEYKVLRQKGTERAFTGRYHDSKEKGIYACAGCGLDLFSSDTKFESGTGWPSFWQPIKPTRVKDVKDESHGMVRVETVCARCDGHLGHVFEDGPKPTGLRYCMNGTALKFKKAEEKK